MKFYPMDLNLTAPSRLLVAILVFSSLVVVGTLVARLDAAITVAAIGGLGILVMLLLWPDVATTAAIFLFYTNAVVALAAGSALVSIALPGVLVLLFAIPLCHHIVLRNEQLRADAVFGLMILLLLVQLASTVFAQDKMLAAQHIAVYAAEGLAIYLLVFNLIRHPATLRRTIWAVLAAGALLGALSLWQGVTGRYDVEFGGLAQRTMDLRVGTAPGAGASEAGRQIILSNRALGSVGDPNRFAQVLLLLLPLAAFIATQARERRSRLVAVLLGGLVLCGVLLSHSRGALVALLGMMLLLLVLRGVRFRHFAVGAVLLFVSVILFAPSYVERLQKLAGVGSLTGVRAPAESDAVLRGRATEMLAAFHVFLDHPILGVGPGHYAPYYSMDYQNLPEVKLRDIGQARRAHSLYFEIAAETGLIGLVVFLAIPAFLISQFWRYRKEFQARAPDASALATAMIFSLLAYYGTGLFLHLSYARYYWFLLALAGATLSVLRGLALVETPARTRGRG